jgi:hypothetical protein
MFFCQELSVAYGIKGFVLMPTDMTFLGSQPGGSNPWKLKMKGW